MSEVDEKEFHEIDWSTARMSDEDLKKFVLDYCAGHIFTNLDMMGNEHLTRVVFIPLAFLKKPYSPESVAQVGLVWEHMSEAGPRAINGLPTFMSVRFMHKDDWSRARLAIIKEVERQKNIELPPIGGESDE